MIKTKYCYFHRKLRISFPFSAIYQWCNRWTWSGKPSKSYQ